VSPEELVAMPDAARVDAVNRASDLLLVKALEVAKRIGAAYAAADIAYEMGRRVGEADEE
jgi:hypothetical protein